MVLGLACGWPQVLIIFTSMTVHTGDLPRGHVGVSPEEITKDLRDLIAGGRPWYPALLDAIARWRLPYEWVDGRYYCYLIGGEAFDWLLLAERLLQTVADLVPEAELEALLFHGEPPIEQTEEEFRRALGEAKHRAHLNYQYGVVVEEALQLSIEEELHKELRSRVWGRSERIDEAVFERIYGKSREELLALFREQRGQQPVGMISLQELKEFLYWLFRYRLRQCDRAKVASDTRRGLTQMARMESRSIYARTALAAEPQGLIEGFACVP
jgi:hypothetical protein